MKYGFRQLSQNDFSIMHDKSAEKRAHTFGFHSNTPYCVYEYFRT